MPPDSPPLEMAGKPNDPDICRQMELLRASLGFADVCDPELGRLAVFAFFRTYPKNATIFSPDSACNHFYLVAEGLVKVSIYAPSGFRLTYLLAQKGEPINLVGPLTGACRSMSAKALKDCVLLAIHRDHFLPWACKNPTILLDIIDILGKAVDSANLRILDMVEKRVEQRLRRILSSLFAKFGSPLQVTSSELAELAGTTTETAIRSLGRIKAEGVIRSSRGKIDLLDPSVLTDTGSRTLWL